MNPYANMRAPQGGFDLRSIDDGAPVQNVGSSKSKTVLIASVIVGAAAFALGGGLGIASVGRANMNTANHAAKAVKGELETMQKKLGDIGLAVARSQQRMAAAKKDTLSYDPQFIADLKAIKLDPRPNTATIFRVDFFRLPDADVDKLFNYYYDTIALYNEIERHVRRTENDTESLKAYADKTAATANKNYGLVFDNSGKIIVGNLVEVGDQVCKNGGQGLRRGHLVGFKIRSGSGAPWVDRKTTNKLDLANLVPMKPTPFMDAVMTGSPDQVRQESYKQRVANIRTLLHPADRHAERARRRRQQGRRPPRHLHCVLGGWIRNTAKGVPATSRVSVQRVIERRAVRTSARPTEERTRAWASGGDAR